MSSAMSAVSLGGVSIAPHKLDASKHSSAALRQSLVSLSTASLSTASVSTSTQTSSAQSSHSSVSSVLSASSRHHVAPVKSNTNTHVASPAIPPSISHELAQPLSASYSLKTGPNTVSAILHQPISSEAAEPAPTRHFKVNEASIQVGPYPASHIQEAPVNIFAVENDTPTTTDDVNTFEQAHTDTVVTTPNQQASSVDTSTQVEDEASEQNAQQQEINKQIEQKQQQIELAEAAEIAELTKRDVEVKTHEQAHAAVGGSLAQSPTYEYEKGPDGRRYAVDGEVSIDMSTVAGDPQATLTKMQKVYAAAMAPVQPSLADIRVAAQALQNISEAKQALALERQQSVMSTEESQKIIELGDVFADPDAVDPLAKYMNEATETSSLMDNVVNNITNEMATELTQVTSSQSTLTANAQSDVVSSSQQHVSDIRHSGSAERHNNHRQHSGYQDALAANVQQDPSYSRIAFYV